jgi:hypothetical protein
MRVHCHRERGGGVRVVSVGTCRADLWLAVGCLGPNRAGRMDHHLFKIGYLYLVKCLGALRQGRHCDHLKTHGPRTDRSIPLQTNGWFRNNTATSSS